MDGTKNEGLTSETTEISKRQPEEAGGSLTARISALASNFVNPNREKNVGQANHESSLNSVRWMQ